MCCYALISESAEKSLMSAILPPAQNPIPNLYPHSAKMEHSSTPNINCNCSTQLSNIPPLYAFALFLSMIFLYLLLRIYSIGKREFFPFSFVFFSIILVIFTYNISVQKRDIEHK